MSLNTLSNSSTEVKNVPEKEKISVVRKVFRKYYEPMNKYEKRIKWASKGGNSSQRAIRFSNVENEFRKEMPVLNMLRGYMSSHYLDGLYKEIEEIKSLSSSALQELKFKEFVEIVTTMLALDDLRSTVDYDDFDNVIPNNPKERDFVRSCIALIIEEERSLNAETPFYYNEEKRGICASREDFPYKDVVIIDTDNKGLIEDLKRLFKEKLFDRKSWIKKAKSDPNLVKENFYRIDDTPYLNDVLLVLIKQGGKNQENYDELYHIISTHNYANIEEKNKVIKILDSVVNIIDRNNNRIIRGGRRPDFTGGEGVTARSVSNKEKGKKVSSKKKKSRAPKRVNWKHKTQ